MDFTKQPLALLMGAGQIEQELAHKIIKAAYQDNIQLLGMLDESSRVIMQRDSRWWDANSYLSRRLFSKPNFILDKTELVETIEQADLAFKKFQLVNSRWWHPDYYSSRPLIPQQLSTLDHQTLLNVVDKIIPALIRLEIINQTKPPHNSDINYSINQRQIPHTVSWVNTKAMRLIHQCLIDVPFRIMRRIRMKATQILKSNFE